jgi:hypothetical protein
MSRSGELKVPTYAIRGAPEADVDGAEQPAVATNAADAFRKDRREKGGRIMADLSMNGRPDGISGRRRPGFRTVKKRSRS